MQMGKTSEAPNGVRSKLDPLGPDSLLYITHYYGEHKVVCIIDPQTDHSMLCPSRNRALSF